MMDATREYGGDSSQMGETSDFAVTRTRETHMKD